DGEPFSKTSGSLPAGRRTRPLLRSGLVLVDIVDRVLDGRDLLGGVVRDLDPELLLERHDQLDDVETVGAEIVDEARFLGDLVRFDAQMLDDDLLNAVGSLAHSPPFPRGSYCWHRPSRSKVQKASGSACRSAGPGRRRARRL